jgi:DNA-binding transcriptional ArsR family regulator
LLRFRGRGGDARRQLGRHLGGNARQDRNIHERAPVFAMNNARPGRMARAVTSGIPEVSPLERRAGQAYLSFMSGNHPAVAEVAALVGNPARANILIALLDGRALTATELAYAAGVSPQTTSEHLARLRDANLLTLTKQGRHNYFRLGSPQVARMLEGIMLVAADGPQRYRPRWNGDDRLRTARTCYDHIAGRLGVALADALTRRKHVHLTDDGGVVTRAGEKLLSGFGVTVDAVKSGRRTFCRPCLDWSERRPHLAGALGAALADRCLALGWISRVPRSRVLTISAKGESGFRDTFGVRLGSGAAD